MKKLIIKENGIVVKNFYFSDLESARSFLESARSFIENVTEIWPDVDWSISEDKKDEEIWNEN